MCYSASSLQSTIQSPWHLCTNVSQHMHEGYSSALLLMQHNEQHLLTDQILGCRFTMHVSNTWLTHCSYWLCATCCIAYPFKLYNQKNDQKGIYSLKVSNHWQPWWSATDQDLVQIKLLCYFPCKAFCSISINLQHKNKSKDRKKNPTTNPLYRLQSQ